MKLDENLKFKQSSEVVQKKMEGKTYLLETEKGRLRVLNETAAFIWQECRRVTTIAELSKKVCREYEVKPKTAKKDVARFIQLYLKENLLEKA